MFLFVSKLYFLPYIYIFFLFYFYNYVMFNKPARVLVPTTAYFITCSRCSTVLHHMDVLCDTVTLSGEVLSNSQLAYGSRIADSKIEPFIALEQRYWK